VTPEWLTPGEVAAIFRVDPKTVTRWGNKGKIRSVRTPGGHRRYSRAHVMELLADTGVNSDHGTSTDATAHGN
jgi:excisionase family DNA binding protein